MARSARIVALATLALTALAAQACSRAKHVRSPQEEAILGAIRASREQTLKRMCAANDALACAAFGNRANARYSANADDGAARKALEKSCEGNEPYGCHQLGALLRHTGSSEDYTRGEALMRGACRGGLELCGKNMAPSESQRALLRYLGARCDAGTAAGCLQAGSYLLWWEEDGRRRDGDELERAHGYFERGCAQKLSTSCLYQGFLHETGALGKADRERAVALYTTACELRDKVGCNLARERGAAVAPQGSSSPPLVAPAGSSAAPAGSAPPSPASSAAPAKASSDPMGRPAMPATAEPAPPR